MTNLQQLAKWQTVIQHLPQLVHRAAQRPNPAVLPIRPLHATTASGVGPRRGEVAVGVEGEEAIKIIEGAGMALGQTPGAVTRAGRKWVGQTISRHVYVER